MAKDKDCEGLYYDRVGQFKVNCIEIKYNSSRIVLNWMAICGPMNCIGMNRSIPTLSEIVLLAITLCDWCEWLKLDGSQNYLNYISIEFPN